MTGLFQSVLTKIFSIEKQLRMTLSTTIINFGWLLSKSQALFKHDTLFSSELKG